MALTPKIQIVILDGRDYILEHQDFSLSDKEKIVQYVWKQVTNLDAVKIQIKKWDR